MRFVSALIANECVGKERAVVIMSVVLPSSVVGGQQKNRHQRLGRLSRAGEEVQSVVSDFLRDEEHMLFGPLVIFEVPNDTASVCDDLKRFGDAKDAVINGRSHARIQLFL